MQISCSAPGMISAMMPRVHVMCVFGTCGCQHACACSGASLSGAAGGSAFSSYAICPYLRGQQAEGSEPECSCMSPSCSVSSWCHCSNLTFAQVAGRWSDKAACSSWCHALPGQAKQAVKDMLAPGSKVPDAQKQAWPAASTLPDIARLMDPPLFLPS